MALDLRTSELEHNFIKERVNNTGKHFDEITSKLHHYVDKLASLRDSGDDVAKCISNFASKENCNQTLRLRLGEFSDVLLSIQEYRDAQVYRTSVKIIHELENFKPFCKQTKADVKKCFDAQVKVLKRKSDLEKARSKNPSNWQKIAEKEVNQAQEESLRMTQELRRIVDHFERKKLEDLQRIFLEFIKIEIIFHAKAIELCTKAFNLLQDINIEEDLHEFNSHFKARTSSMDAEALSPTSHVTIPKTVDTNIEEYHSPLNTFFNPQTFKGIQGTPRSVFTLKTADMQTANSDSISESFTESELKPTK